MTVAEEPEDVEELEVPEIAYDSDIDLFLEQYGEIADYLDIR